MFNINCRLAIKLTFLFFTVFAVVFGANNSNAFSQTELDADEYSVVLDQTFTVNRTDDTSDANTSDNICDADLTTAGSQCTLRAAIEQANATPGADTINFSFPVGTITVINLTRGRLLINQSLTINGSGARNLIVQRSLDAATANFNIFNIIGPDYNSTSPITVNVSGISIVNGAAEGSLAGGIYNFGASTLNLTEVSLRNNRGANGGAILNAGRALNLRRSTLNNNTATASGGAIYNGFGTANISNSTIANNSAANGGGIFNSNDGDNSNTLVLNNVTVTRNSATVNGGGVTNQKTAFVRNTIVAGNSAPVNPDINGVADFVSLGNNLIGISDLSVGFSNAIGGDIVGTTNAPVNPLLDQLSNNGGQTDTIALFPSSPAVDAGNFCVVNADCPSNNPSLALLTDQRGGSFPRIVGVTVDIGAYELDVPIPSISTVTPARIIAGSNGLELIVKGSGFVNGSIVQIEGQDRATTFVSPTELRAQISAADIRAAGQLLVNVFNPGPGGGISNGVTITVFSCSYSVNPSSRDLPSAGGASSVNVVTAAECTWTATTDVSWITITNASGSGNGTVTFTVQPNNGVARTGKITIANQTVTINQASGCAFTISPASSNVGSSAGSGSFNLVASDAGCTWTATSNASWIIVNNATGTGSVTISFAYQENIGPQRTGTISVGGRTFTLTQASGCTYQLTATSLRVGALGGNGSIGVTTAAGCVWTAASNAPWITITTGASGSGNGTVNFNVTANTGADRTGTLTVAGQTVTIIQSSPANFVKTLFDFDGDGRADLSVFRPSLGAWYILQSSDNTPKGTVFGQAGDATAPADYDGDGRTDIAVFRSGFWYRLNSSNNEFVSLQFGSPGDIPVPADFDGDGKADIAVFRPSNGVWYRTNSSDNQFVAARWGESGDVPLRADVDGDGKADLAVFRPSTASWYVLRSSDNSFFGLVFGLPGDIPTAADFDGDKKTDIAVYRPSNGTWYRINSSTNEFVPQRFGTAEDKPVAADYDGDGKADLGLYRPSNGTWNLIRSTAGASTERWGTAGDVPIPALNQ